MKHLIAYHRNKRIRVSKTNYEFLRKLLFSNTTFNQNILINYLDKEVIILQGSLVK